MREYLSLVGHFAIVIGSYVLVGAILVALIILFGLGLWGWALVLLGVVILFAIFGLPLLLLTLFRDVS